MNSNTPIFAEDACPRCQWKPCLSLAGLGKPYIALIHRGEIPYRCPLLVHSMDTERYIFFFDCFTKSEVIHKCTDHGGHAISNLHSYTSVTQLTLTLINQGHLRLIAAPLGSGARATLNAWYDAKFTSYRKAKKAYEEVMALELEKEKPKPTFVEATWVWLADPNMPGCEEKEITVGAMFDSVLCKVDAQGLMPGDIITFNLFLKGRNGKEDIKITTDSGRVSEKRKDNAAVVKWMIPDQIREYKIQPKIDEVYFISRSQSHKLEIRSPLLKLKPVWKIWLQIDVDHPKAKDDELILTDESGTVINRVKISTMREINENFVELSFDDLDIRKKYTLMRDYGPDEDGGKEFLFEDLTPEHLDSLSHET